MEPAFAQFPMESEPERFLLELLFASIRPGAALAALPALGGQLIPVRVRIGLAGAFGYLLLGTPHPPAVPPELLALAGLAAIAGEILIGAVAALALHAAFAAALIAGDWLAQSMGLGFATLVDPGAPPTPVLSALFALLIWSIFLGSGGHLLFLQLIAESYRAMPNAAALFEPERLWAIAGWGGFAFASGLIAALPLGATLLLVNLGLAVAARSAPQLNLFSVGFPLMLLIGLAALPVGLPALSDSLSGALAAMQAKAAEVLLG
ncbi:flagellar biosynthetic protein FliR [Sandaracinobacter sp. RS1-74]|uniref:flagellar biosynthetic protein FliR n=1 Tax=Sandaracinobacteroides sayramensis TaxID=2913411 RepID=UPI001EDB90A9|nr:flagellar biosynthetic protein FliR [Sandaracinobacteroides sayramensis]MCG2841953.1 flagellar biosynthetic protein FliR [Sandaracinobacteroides sayramensis]